MEGYKDLKIHQNINVKLTTEKPNLQVSIGALRLNNVKYNPAIMSRIQTLIVVFLLVFLANLMNYLIEDFQSDDDLSEYVVWIHFEIVLLLLRIFIPTLVIYKNQGCHQFMKSAVNELASEFKCHQSRNSSRLSGTQITNNLLPLETTQGHKSHEEATHGLDALIKIEDGTQEQEDVKTQQTVVLNTVNIELEPSDKPDLKNIKEEIKYEPGLAQEMPSVIKGKGKGKGQSNFKKGKVLSPKHILDDKPEGIKQKSRYKEEEKKLTRSALASRGALKKWKERTKQRQVSKPKLTQ